MKPVTMFKSEDGSIFENEIDCLEYEVLDMLNDLVDYTDAKTFEISRNDLEIIRRVVLGRKLLLQRVRAVG
jgi:hypothetical protein